MSTLELLRGSDNTLKLTGFSYEDSSGVTQYLNSATVTYQLLDDNADVVDSGSMGYVAASNGNYIATLVDTLVVKISDYYSAVIIADAGPDQKRKWTLDVKVIDG